MKALRTILLFPILLLAALPGYAAGPIRSDISIQGTMFALSKAQALQFTSSHHLDSEATDGFKGLQVLVEQKKAEVAANPAVTTQNGQRGTSESGTTRLEVEPVQSPSGDEIEVALQLNYGDSIKLNTTTT